MRIRSRAGVAQLGLVMLLAGAGVLGALALRGPESGEYVVRYGVDGSRAESLGSRVGGEWDKLYLEKGSGSLVLRENMPVVATLNVATFEAGYTGQPIRVETDLARSLTINGVSRELSQPVTVVTGMVTDTLSIEAGETVSFRVATGDGERILEVTPMGGTFAGESCNEDTQPLTARFLLRRPLPAAALSTYRIVLEGDVDR